METPTSTAEHTEAKVSRGELPWWAGMAATSRLGGPFLFSLASFFAMGCVVPRRFFYFVHFEREMAVTVVWYLATCVAAGLLARRLRFGPVVAGASVVAALIWLAPITMRCICYGRPESVIFDTLDASPLAHAVDYGILVFGALLAARMARRPAAVRA